jgi:hypothetical protein
VGPSDKEEYGLPCPKDTGEEAFSPPDPKGERRRRTSTNRSNIIFILFFWFLSLPSPIGEGGRVERNNLFNFFLDYI